MINIDNNKEEILKAARIAYATVEEKFGTDTLVLEISGISALADYFIISSGNSHSQLKAMADAVEEKMYELGLKLRHSEGYATGKWVLLDFGSIIVHLFDKEEREFYNIEKNWGKAKRIEM